MPAPTLNLGTADHIEIVGGEDGFEMYVTTLTGVRYVLNIHGCTMNLMNQVETELRPYWDEAEAARVSRPVTDDADAYPANDPKHPNWHSVHADLYPKDEL